MLVFIDESGDQGFGPNSSPFMVFAMVIFKNRKDAQVTDKAIAALKYNGIRRTEFKFRGSTINVRDAFFNTFSNRQFEIRAVVIEKQRFLQIASDFQSYFSKGQHIYYFGLFNLLKSYPLKNARIRLDEKSDRQLKLFLKGHMSILNAQSSNTIKEYIMKDSEKDNLIQLADMVVGAIARSYYPNKKNYNRWRRKLKLKKSEIIVIK